jgi:CRP/FNR family cyclic AMP-dependent transcriptional regulator
LERRDILAVLERNPSAWLKLVVVLSQRLRQTNEVFAEVALLHLPARLAKAMLRIAKTDSANASAAKIKFSQRELADMLGGSRESVNKCLRKWQRNGIVKISEGSIIITKPAALEKIAEDDLGAAG